MAGSLKTGHYWDVLKQGFIFKMTGMEKNNLKGRRIFLKNGLKAMGGSILLGSYLSSCSESFYETLSIDKSLCIGCGDCEDVCNYNAIVTDGVSSYSINVDGCTFCSWCVNVCEDNAIQMPVKNYLINATQCSGCTECLPYCEYDALQINSNTYTIKSGCIGCGDCITVCKYKGDAISYVVENYSVKSGQCHGCVERCSGVCSQGAISKKSNGKAYIDTSKCTKCGNCLKACSHNAITNAYVVIDDDKCVNCGDCYSACSNDQIEKSANSDTETSYINRDACTNCGSCIDNCPEDAIYLEESGDYDPEILSESCTTCGKCYDACTEQNAISRTIATVSIDQTNCMKCNKCYDVCQYGAVKTD